MDFGQVLSTTPPIVESIFKTVSWRDLELCAEVCELWRQVAETEKNRRKEFFSFFHGCREVLYLTYRATNVECLVLIGGHVPIDKDSQELGVIGARNELIKQLRDLKPVPYFCLTFATADFVHSFDYLFPQSEIVRNAKRRKRNPWYNTSEDAPGLTTGMESVFRKYLPEHCRLASCVANSVIGRRDESLPFEISSGSAISGIILPHVPGVKVYSFSVKCELLRMISPDVNIKCLLMFGNINFTLIERDIHNCMQREKSKIAIGGVSVRGLEHENAATYVAFCGDNVEAASIVINEKDDAKAVEEKLKHFEVTGLLNNRCFAVIFSPSKYRFAINSQASTFHKLYPKVPVTGVCGEVQICLEYLPNVTIKKKPLFHNRLPVSTLNHHYHTTVFVLISLKI